MNVLVTGSAGHLGEALMRTLADAGHNAVGLDILPSEWTHRVGSIADADFVRASMTGVDVVLHTATLHKPHVATHTKQAFIDVNVTGTLNLLEAAVAHGVSSFVFTSTTSVFSRRCRPAEGEPATWVTEMLEPLPKNIYGATKLAAERLCELFAYEQGLPCIVLRTSRFFPEADDRAEARARFDDLNAKVNELLYRRVDLGDAARAHLCAVERAAEIGFDRYIITATTPFCRDDCTALRSAAASVVARYHDFEPVYRPRGWRMLPELDRVYVNTKARVELGWAPRVDFGTALARLANDQLPFGPLTALVGSKGYHNERFDDLDGPFPMTE